MSLLVSACLACSWLLPMLAWVLQDLPQVLLLLPTRDGTEEGHSTDDTEWALLCGVFRAQAEATRGGPYGGQSQHTPTPTSSMYTTVLYTYTYSPVCTVQELSVLFVSTLCCPDPAKLPSTAPC